MLLAVVTHAHESRVEEVKTAILDRDLAQNVEVRSSHRGPTWREVRGDFVNAGVDEDLVKFLYKTKVLGQRLNVPVLLDLGTGG